MNNILNTKTAVIYGAGGALGSGVAETFAAQGAAVHLVGRTAEPLERTAAAIAADGGTAHVAALDVLDEQAVQAHLDGIQQLDVSFNLVTRGDVHGFSLLELSVDDFMAPVTTGVRANFITARAAARKMTAQGSGVILALTSGSSQGAGPNMGGTGPADSASESFMRELASEVGPHGVRVCGLWTAGVPETFGRPGDTNAARIATGLSSEQIEGIIGGMAMLRRAPRLAQVAETAAFLASDHAGGITATIVNVTCGLTVDR